VCGISTNKRQLHPYGCGGKNILSVFPSGPLYMNMKTIKTKCANCNSEIEKSISEYNRNKKIGRDNFCNNACHCSYKNKQWTPEYRKEHCYKISKHAGARQDEYSPFRPYLSKSRFSVIAHGRDMNIDACYLKKIWEDQNGTCPYTGIKMGLPRNTKTNHTIKSLKKASLDRIDSSKGYIKGNVEFVCQSINWGKNVFSKQEMQDFITEIRKSCIS
jgi:hypothetical protein